MLIGRVKRNGRPILVSRLGPDWFNFTQAWMDMRQAVDGETAPEITDAVKLIRSGLFTRATLSRVGEFVQRYGRMEQYRIEKPARWCPPGRPGKVLAMGRNYRAHVKEFDNRMPDSPVVFSKAASACIGSGEPIRIPQHAGRVDYEGEVAVVIGKTCSGVTPSAVREYIAGYTLINDVTARDMQRKAMGEGNPWFLAKSFDTFCPVGPVIVLADVFDWPPVIPIETRLNGELRQQSDTGHFIFSLDTIISYISRYITLEPGDLVATGTPEGVGPLQAGDVVEICAPEIGCLCNPVTSGE
ncbi:MAG TPA: fumarylacetoacetate hydrolase family protein [Candidatus Hydrogenedentes bacterium]|nr:fumarylacetoacetate hydrolase family protein [Candidatus Hydrogenedentota bacterium]